MELEYNQNNHLQGEQEQPYTLQNIPISISIQDYKVSLQNCILQIKQDGFTILIEKPNDQWVSLFTSFRNTTSVGMSGTNLLIFVGDAEDDLQEQPEILKIIREGKPCNLNLIGNCFIIELFLEKEGKNVLKEINDILTNYMGDADQNNSLYDDNEDFEQMISADDIDQNGNIIKGNKNESEQGEEDEQEMEQQIKDTQDKK